MNCFLKQLIINYYCCYFAILSEFYIFGEHFSKIWCTIYCVIRLLLYGRLWYIVDITKQSYYSIRGLNNIE